MKHKMQLKVTITKIFEAEFDDTPAAARMFQALESDRYIGTLTGTSGDGWTVRQATEHHSVEPVREKQP